MKKAIPLLVILLILTACSGQKMAVKSAADTKAATMQLLADYRRAGLIDDEEALLIEKHRKAAQKALERWAEAVENNEGPERAIQNFNKAMRVLSQELFKVEVEDERAPKADVDNEGNNGGSGSG